MNPKLSYTSAGIVLSIIILVLALLMSIDLRNPGNFWIGTFVTIVLINVLFYLIGKRKKA